VSPTSQAPTIAPGTSLPSVFSRITRLGLEEGVVFWIVAAVIVFTVVVQSQKSSEVSSPETDVVTEVGTEVIEASFIKEFQKSYQDKKLPQAQAAFDNLEKINPNNDELLALSENLQELRGEFNEWLNLGKVRADSGRWSEAEAAVSEAAKIDDNSDVSSLRSYISQRRAASASAAVTVPESDLEAEASSEP
jgi:tetratricopeptide (TPR) repeat protein